MLCVVTSRGLSPPPPVDAAVFGGAPDIAGVAEPHRSVCDSRPTRALRQRNSDVPTARRPVALPGRFAPGTLAAERFAGPGTQAAGNSGSSGGHVESLRDRHGRMVLVLVVAAIGCIGPRSLGLGPAAIIDSSLPLTADPLDEYCGIRAELTNTLASGQLLVFASAEGDPVLLVEATIDAGLFLAWPGDFAGSPAWWISLRPAMGLWTWGGAPNVVGFEIGCYAGLCWDLTPGRGDAEFGEHVLRIEYGRSLLIGVDGDESAGIESLEISYAWSY